ncbi:high mobility group box domain-containing protein, partial [Chytridium lagenaria]
PRPLNAFLLYRRDLQPHILALRQTEDKTVNSKDASKWIADAWNREAEDVKEKYHSWARELKEEHLRKYPDFKFKP